jgi:aspartate/methionine/tyrosine aminotransferase
MCYNTQMLEPQDEKALNELSDKVLYVLGAIESNPTFVSALEAIYESADSLLNKHVLENKRKLSSGTSDYEAFTPYLDTAINSLQTHKSYRSYAPPGGSLEARTALSLKEGLKFNDRYKYSISNFCITNGATGAISVFLEYIKNNYSNGEIIIPCPSYYVFKLCATEIGLKLTEVAPNIRKGQPMSSIDDIISAVTDNTKVVALTQPASPSGEPYPPKDIVKLLEHAKEKNYIILFDEVFSELSMSESEPATNSDKAAYDLGLMDYAVFVKSYSKNLNIPGFRIGYIFSSNKALVRELTKIQEHRSFFAGASNFDDIIILDSFYQTANDLHTERDVGLAIALRRAVRVFNDKNIDIPKRAATQDQFERYISYKKSTIKYYKDNLLATKKAFGVNILKEAETIFAFNTFFQLDGLDRVNQFDFCLNLFLYYGVKIQTGPYFGFQQHDWEDRFGFWVRISFSRDKDYLIDGVNKLLLFKEDYQNNPKKYIHLERQFV